MFEYVAELIETLIAFGLQNFMPGDDHVIALQKRQLNESTAIYRARWT